MGRKRAIAVAAAGLLAATTLPCGAVVFESSGDSSRNTTPPTGAWAGSGWSNVVPIGAFLGTVIHSNALLVARHTDLGVGSTFSWDGHTYSVTGLADDVAADTDLRVLFFNGGLSNVARLQAASDETGRWTVVQGRGRERGSTVVSAGRTNGWKWGAATWVRRWGVNRFEGYADLWTNGDSLLAWASFDAGMDSNECMLSEFDSSGPAFVNAAGGWRCVGVASYVDPALFSPTGSSTDQFVATCFDYGGLYYWGGTGAWYYADPAAGPWPCIFLISRVAPRLGWLTNVVPGLVLRDDPPRRAGTAVVVR
jgi:hypothetical protein